MTEFENLEEKVPESEEGMEKDLKTGEDISQETQEPEPVPNEKDSLDLREDGGDLSSRIEKLEAEKNELINIMQRLQADFENYRRRTRGEKEDLLKYGSETIISRMLPVLDNFERALTSPKDGGESKSFFEGVEMIFRQFYQVLTNEGLEPVASLGCPFDPNFHEAVMRVEGDESQKGIVVDEMQKGYIFKGKLIRPSMVKVAN